MATASRLPTSPAAALASGTARTPRAPPSGSLPTSGVPFLVESETENSTVSETYGHYGHCCPRTNQRRGSATRRSSPFKLLTRSRHYPAPALLRMRERRRPLVTVGNVLSRIFHSQKPHSSTEFVQNP